MSQPPFHLLHINKDDGSPMGFTVEVEPAFEEWFVKSQNLGEWDDELFRSWFKDFLHEAMRDRLRSRSEQQCVDIWATTDMANAHDTEEG